VYFNIPSNYTVYDIGAKFIMLKTLGNEKMWVTVMVTTDREYWTVIMLYWIKELPKVQLHTCQTERQ
jgi:hypothetical protein